MSRNLKLHTVMKASGIEWLGDIPMSWEVRRNGRLFSQRNETGFSHLPILEVSLKTGVRIRDFNKADRKQVMTDLEKYKRAISGDIAYNTMRMWQGAVGIVPADGLISPAYVIAQPFPETNAKYFNYLFKTPAYMQEIDNHSRGIVKDRNRLYWEYFKAIPSCFPPPYEQDAIVRYLDHVDIRVRRLMKSKQKLIVLLDEQKQAIIHGAMTRGLDPDVPLKDSGIEWLGKMPIHWEIWQLGRIGSFSKGSGGTKDDEIAVGVPCVRYGDLYTSHNFFIESTKSYVSADRAADYTPIQYCDILFAGSGETIEEIGKSAVNLLAEPACCGGDVIIYRPTIDVDAKYLGLATDCHRAAYQKSCMGRGVTVMHIYADELKYLFVTLPPLTEQVAITKYLGQVTADIDNSISRIKSEIKLLGEYITRLISDVVTGKLDVRDAAAALPEIDPLIDNEIANDIDFQIDTDLDEFNEDLEEVEA